MSAKVCQLCGKTLSRLRVGSDGDFCSKEHRTQYGLRRGMDRLEESNKVSSLMRRRENPRQIAPASLMCNSALNTRGFLDAKAYEPRTELAPFAPVLRSPERPKLVGRGDRYIPPQSSRMAGNPVSRGVDPARVKIHGRASDLLFPSPERKLKAQVSRAPMAALRCKVPSAAARRRDYALLRNKAIRVHAGGEPAALRKIALPGTAAMGHHLAACKVAATPVVGNALRVSTALAFGPPRVSKRVFTTPAAMSTALVWPKTPQKISGERRDSTALSRTLAVRITTAKAHLPGRVAAAHRSQFVYPGAKRPGQPKPARVAIPPSRWTGMPWTLADPRTGKFGIIPQSAGFAKRNGVHPLSLTLMAASTNPRPQVAFQPFIPQEPVGCPVVPFTGSTAQAIISAPATAAEQAPAAVAPVTAAPAAAIKLEEHFGGGWENWEGGTDDWLVDVAGVRTGSLALFMPTLELVDYDLEFLARIDSKTLTWVVRATDLQEFMRCTLTAIPGGELEFSRAVVRNGVAEQVIVTSGRIPGKPRTTMTVRTHVEGDSFTVSVDGKPVDSWQESRLYCGGIGFMGAPDDRARLYWVRITSIETLGKEHKK